MLNYSRSIPRNSTHDLHDQMKEHVRGHLSAVADPDDNPYTRADAVKIWQEDDGFNIKICGRLDADADAPYLLGDFNPEDEAKANPLTVTSVDDDPTVLHTATREED